MTGVPAIDARQRASYLRDMGFRRPSRLVTFVTAAAAVVLAAGGFVAGRSGGGGVPVSVPLTPAPRQPTTDPIEFPDKLTLPDR